MTPSMVLVSEEMREKIRITNPVVMVKTLVC